jgi:hypothetical protein
MSPDGTLPSNGHSRDGNDSKEGIDILHHISEHLSIHNDSFESKENLPP